jgi:hypothetical protein
VLAAAIEGGQVEVVRNVAGERVTPSGEEEVLDAEFTRD